MGSEDVSGSSQASTVTSRRAHEDEIYRQPARECSHCKATYSSGNRWYSSRCYGKKNMICRNCKVYTERHPGNRRPIQLQQILRDRDVVSASYRNRAGHSRVCPPNVTMRRKIIAVVNISDSSDDDDSGGQLLDLQPNLDIPKNGYQARYGSDYAHASRIVQGQNIDDQMNPITRGSAQRVAQIPDDGPQVIRAPETRLSKSALSIAKSKMPGGYTIRPKDRQISFELQRERVVLLGLLTEAEVTNRFSNTQATQTCVEKALDHVRRLVIDHGDHASLGLLEQMVEARLHSQEGNTEKIRAIIEECRKIIESCLIPG
ncbi:hypothetical protein WG66_001007 [Moniliophthora roreri]|uniref:Uncharacterized protein n=1 Tax=Moniliophthora roreri TaxID=221103 RepID=A0A0W0F184_MONRR|nr:hypothetical protein WG66_001007 [Moniliophthora roreri]